MFYPTVFAISLSAAVLLFAGPTQSAEPAEPTCVITGSIDKAFNEAAAGIETADAACIDDWYVYGDTTGFYGPIDAAE